MVSPSTWRDFCLQRTRLAQALAGSTHYSLTEYTPALLALPETAAARQQAESTIRVQEAEVAVYVTVQWSFAHWVLLALLGFNRYTVCGFVVVYVSLAGVGGG